MLYWDYMVGHIVRTRFAILLISIGIAAGYFYAGVSAFQHPESWLGFLPELLRANPLAMGIIQAAAIQIVMAVWLVSGIKTVFASVASILLTSLIMFTNPGGIAATFQDISIIFASLALAVLAR